MFQTKFLEGDLDEKRDFHRVNHVTSDIVNEVSAGELDKKIDFHAVKSLALRYFKRHLCWRS